MKFERKNTNRSKRVLKAIFYTSFCLTIFIGVLFGIQDCVAINERITHCEIAGVNSDLIIFPLSISAFVSYLLLLVAYIVFMIIEGLEKPTFIPSNNRTHNKFKNEYVSELTRTPHKTRRPF